MTESSDAGAGAPGAASAPDPARSGSAAAARNSATRWWSSLSFLAGAGRMLRAYSDWLASISWGRFFILAFLFVAAMGILTDMSFFRVAERVSEGVRYEVHVDESGAVTITPQSAADGRRGGAAARKEAAAAQAEAARAASEAKKEIAVARRELGPDDKKALAAGASGGTPDDTADAHITADGVVIETRDHKGNKRITIEKRGVRIETAGSAPAPAIPAVPAAPAAPTVPAPAPPAAPPAPPAVPASGVGGSADQAAAAIAQRNADPEKIRAALTEAIGDLQDLANERTTASRKGALGESLQTFSIFFVFFSIIMKVEAGRRVKVEVKAAAATELAEAEQLKRQLVEARMQTMQAQVEPHFLFNTLASIDHLIETDPPRASAMQKNLIQYLRAALPKMRESSTTLGREVDLIRAYLEILKVRMDDRLQTEFAVPDGLRSAAFPPMMLQSLVENAIKHGLEPKAEGGAIRVGAEIVDGRLRVIVADTGLGFDPENGRTRGTGLGLTNIRERLALLHDGKGTLSVVANSPTGTVVAIEVPYAIGRG